MKNFTKAFIFFFCAKLFAQELSTPTGIALNTTWKQKLYSFAKENLKHPSWGLAHSERDYQLTKNILEKSKENFDEEVLFAAAYMHDLGGLDAYAHENVDHAVRSAELADELLPGMGFPTDKIPSVKEVILGHVYYGPKPASILAQAFRDADILDFMGAMGIARIYGATKELDPSFSSLAPATALIKKFNSSMPEKLSLPASQELLIPKANEMSEFIKAIDQSSYSGQAI